MTRIPTARLVAGTLAGLILGACASPSPPTPPDYDVVIAHGRVIDPESGLDAVRHLGIRDGVVRDVSASPLRGRETIDARGLVVAPGFIDLHQHAQDAAAYRVEALDGTTTAFELETGTADVEGWYEARAGRSLINHGVAVGHQPVRMVVMKDPGRGTPTGAAARRAATAAELAEITRRIDDGLQQGAVGVGVLLGETPAARPWEIVEVFRRAASHQASVHVHLRELEEPQYFLETEEVIALVAATGAAAHIVHVQSSAGEDTPLVLALLRGARARGLDVTTEAYPYAAGMTAIESAAFSDWVSWPDAKFARFEWPPTGERLTRATFELYRRTGGLVVDHSNTEAVVRNAVADPLVIIASDGLLAGGVGHPRVAGTFARVLGHYVREERAITLMEALRKMTIEPARRLERRVPAMKRKGRIREGADADLVIFDPARVIDRATYREPTLSPAGIQHVLVRGVAVVRDGTVREDVLPGQPVRALRQR